MTETERPSPEEIVLYHKDPETKISTITLNRPDHLNAATIGTRLRYAHLLDQANVDDDVKVLVIRGAGDDFGSGADLPELGGLLAESPDAALREELQLDDTDVTFPPRGSYRASATLAQWYADPRSGCRTLADFKKISIIEVKGYCYGWHFYQAADADLVIASDDALFGHPAFRYAGWGPRMWAWAMTMGLRKFQEMVFTGRPFSAEEMYDCNFVNSVVPRSELSDEVSKYATACSRSRPTDAVVMQKSFFQMMKQFQGEYMGSLLTAFLESMGGRVRPDGSDLMLTDDVYDAGLGHAVKANDELFPPEFRLSKSGRKSRRPEKDHDQAAGDEAGPP
jgi:enoyl-CoA hydratase